MIGIHRALDSTPLARGRAVGTVPAAVGFESSLVIQERRGAACKSATGVEVEESVAR